MKKILLILVFLIWASPNLFAATYLKYSDIDDLCKTMGGCNTYTKKFLKEMISTGNGNQVFAIQKSRMFKRGSWGAWYSRNGAKQTCNQYIDSKDGCVVIIDKRKIIDKNFERKFLQIKKGIIVSENKTSKVPVTKSNTSHLYAKTDHLICAHATNYQGTNWSTYRKYHIIEAKRRGFNVKGCNQLTKRGTNQSVTQTVQVPKTEVDKIAPLLDVEDRILVNQIDYSISGQVSDESKVFIEVNGNSVNIVNNTFKIEGSTPIGLNEVEIVAFDEWGNKTSKKIIIDRVIETADNSYQFEDLNPYKLKSKTNKNKLALVIGIEKYESIPNANFADRDAKLFIDYVQRGLGVPENKIKFFFNEDAKERSKFEMVKWLKKNIKSKSEVYIYFSGHGLATNKGQDLYLLANDTITDFIEETAINRNEIFNAVAANNPKSVTAFLDTCYSGAGRTEGETLLAMAKGLVVVDEQQQQLPDNFTLFTAASAQESAWSLPEAQHGTFSYFLMKGMEGEADLDGNKKLTNGELQEYLLDNVSRYAQQQQTPQMIGDPDQVLVKF